MRQLLQPLGGGVPYSTAAGTGELSMGQQRGELLQRRVARSSWLVSPLLQVQPLAAFRWPGPHTLLITAFTDELRVCTSPAA